MSTFLELVQKTARRADPVSTPPSTTVSQVGMNLAFVNWVNDAWMDVQQKHPDWKFMRSSFTVNTVAADGNYTPANCTDVAANLPIASFRAWHRDTLKSYLTSGGVGSERLLPYIPYMSWYNTYNTSNQTDGTPFVFTIANDLSLNLAPKPGDIYTVTGEYQKAASRLSSNADIPALPIEYEDAIMYRALMFYAVNYENSFLYQTSETEFKRLMGRMALTQLPEFVMAEPLT